MSVRKRKTEGGREAEKEMKKTVERGRVRYFSILTPFREDSCCYQLVWKETPRHVCVCVRGGCIVFECEMGLVCVSVCVSEGGCVWCVCVCACVCVCVYLLVSEGGCVWCVCVSASVRGGLCARERKEKPLKNLVCNHGNLSESDWRER